MALPSVVLLSIFLSIAVDKLSEVKSVEHEEGREVEQKDRQRVYRKKQIHALKHPEQGSLYRKTLRSARRLFDGILVDNNQKKDWRKPFATSSHAPLHRAFSIRSNTGPHAAEFSEHLSPKKERKQLNPLRSMMNPLSHIVEREDPTSRGVALRERQKGSIEELDIDRRSSGHSQSSKQQAASVTLEEVQLLKNIRRRRSTASTPDTPMSHEGSEAPHSASYERTQSLPIDPSPTSRVPPEQTTQETLVKLETITEGSDESPTSKLETATGEDSTDQSRFFHYRALYHKCWVHKTKKTPLGGTPTI